MEPSYRFNIMLDHHAENYRETLFYWYSHSEDEFKPFINSEVKEACYEQRHKLWRNVIYYALCDELNREHNSDVSKYVLQMTPKKAYEKFISAYGSLSHYIDITENYYIEKDPEKLFIERIE